MLWLSFQQVSLMNLLFLVLWVFALPFPRIRPTVSSISAVWACVMVVCKMLYQLKVIKPLDYSYNCTAVRGPCDVCSTQSPPMFRDDHVVFLTVIWNLSHSRCCHLTDPAWAITQSWGVSWWSCSTVPSSTVNLWTPSTGGGRCVNVRAESSPASRYSDTPWQPNSSLLPLFRDLMCSRLHRHHQ